MDDFCEKVVAECQRARKTHPPTHSIHEGLGVLMEEFDEFQREVFKKDASLIGLESELVQIAAVCRNIYNEVVVPAKQKNDERHKQWAESLYDSAPDNDDLRNKARKDQG